MRDLEIQKKKAEQNAAKKLLDSIKHKLFGLTTDFYYQKINLVKIQLLQNSLLKTMEKYLVLFMELLQKKTKTIYKWGISFI